MRMKFGTTTSAGTSMAHKRMPLSVSQDTKKYDHAHIQTVRTQTRPASAFPWTRTTISGRTNHVQLRSSLPSPLSTGLFISPSGISELDCATTKTDTAERSLSISRESLQVFFCTRGLGVLPGSTAMG